MADIDVFPKELLKSEDFREDLSRFLALDAALLEKLRPNLPARPTQLRDEEFVRLRAERTGIEVSDYKDFAVIARMLVTASSAENSSSTTIIDFLTDQLNIDIDSATKSKVREFIDSVTDNDIEVEGVNAFSYGETFVGVDFKRLISPADSDHVLFHFGGNLTIDYLDATSSRKALSLNLSHSELTGLVAELQRELELLEALRKKLEGRVHD